MSAFGNHSLTFRFIKDGDGYIVKATGPNVPYEHNTLGRVERAGNRGWNYGYIGNECGYVTGSRKDAAEMLAVKVGLLDGNFNDPGYEPEACELRENGFQGVYS